MSGLAGFWVAVGMVFLGICLDHGLTNIAQAIERLVERKP
jgi:hypothetical protein